MVAIREDFQLASEASIDMSGRATKHLHAFANEILPLLRERISG